MNRATLTRFFSDDKQSLGIFTSTRGSKSFLAKSLELPWKGNKNDISCIPADTYLVKWTRSPRLSEKALNKWLKLHPTMNREDAPEEVRNVFTYQVMDVPGRSGIRFHSANFFYELLGCISLGAAHKDINVDQNLDLIHSGNTITAFNEFMNKEDFMLTVVTGY